MSNTLDIRTAQAAIDVILFGEEAAPQGDVPAVAFRVTAGNSAFCYVEEQDGGDIVRVAFEDIPNLILALKKAAELWEK